MRLWSIDPSYLDRIGLVALWREGLLARKVLSGKTKGYKHHPQLERFKESKKPLAQLDLYLQEVLKEACSRNYNFNASKITKGAKKGEIKIGQGQLDYEFQHLLLKLKSRDYKKYKAIKAESKIRPNKAFKAIKGPVASWEKIKA